jgi:hypothetical protein
MADVIPEHYISVFTGTRVSFDSLEVEVRNNEDLSCRILYLYSLIRPRLGPVAMLQSSSQLSMGREWRSRS